MVRAAISCLALPALGLHAFVPSVPQRPVLLRGPSAPAPAAARVDQATQRPAAPGAYLQPLRPFPASPLSGWRVSQDATMRLPVPLTAPAAITPALYVYRYLMMGGMCMIAAFVLRRLLARPSAVRLRAWARTVREMVKKVVYTIFATVATSVMTMTLLFSVASGPAVALTTREAPVQQTRVQRVVDTGKEMRRLDEPADEQFEEQFEEDNDARVEEVEQVKRRPKMQKMLKYSAKNYIFSDDLTSVSPLEREFDDLLWHSLANRQAIQKKILLNVGEGLLLVGAARVALEGFENLQKRQERKEQEQELKLTGRYVSVDASDVKEFTNAETGKTSKVKQSYRNQPIKGSLVIHYEIPKANGRLAKEIRNKVEDKRFAENYVEKLRESFSDLHKRNEKAEDSAGDKKTRSMQILQGFEEPVSPKIPAVQAPEFAGLPVRGGVIKGKVYFTSFEKKALETVLAGFGNSAARDKIKSCFGEPLSEMFGIKDRKKGEVMIMNIIQNRDPQYGEGSKMKNQQVRQLLKNAAPWFLRWFESTNASGDGAFWANDVQQDIYQDKKLNDKKKEKKDKEW